MVEDLLSSLVGALVLVVVVLVVALVVLRRRDAPADLRRDLERREQRVAERESRLDTEARHLEDRARELGDQHDVLARTRAELADLEQERRLVLERAAGLTADEAKAALVGMIESQAKRDAVHVVRDIEAQAQQEGETRAREIIAGSIQRLATEQTTESVITVLHLPSDDMKGRIIGREGRNIRAFESVTGVNLIIDDSPEAVLLSCFDPVRREVARIALEALVLDGRIHPQRIEDAHERAKTEVDDMCLRAAEDALVDVGITDLHPELVGAARPAAVPHVVRAERPQAPGRVGAHRRPDGRGARPRPRTPAPPRLPARHRQGADPRGGGLARERRREIARKYGESADVVHAIEAHHNEVEPRTVEAVLTQAADAISGGRPGARRESLEAYVKRLERLEEIGLNHDGVDKVFAMQAGREVRVMVLPDAVDDLQAQVIAREIAKQVESDLTYPGQIRVTVIRESRATEIAH